MPLLPRKILSGALHPDKHFLLGFIFMIHDIDARASNVTLLRPMQRAKTFHPDNNEQAVLLELTRGISDAVKAIVTRDPEVRQTLSVAANTEYLKALQLMIQAPPLRGCNVFERLNHLETLLRTLASNREPN